MAAEDDLQDHVRPGPQEGGREASRRAEEEREADRERFRITLASIGDGVVSTDAEGRVTFLNAVAEGLTGWTAADAYGRPLVEIFRILNQYTRAEVENPALRALRDGVAIGLANHTILIARDGTERPIDDSAAPMFAADGTPIGSVLVFRDVTERTRAHEAQARLAAIVESSDDAIVSKNLDGVVRTWNRGAERLFGWSRDEAVGRPLAELIIPPDRWHEEAEILERLRRGERVEPFETIRRRKDGSLVEISATMSPVRDDAGQVVAASKIARDITAAKAAERALRASEAQFRFLAELAVATQDEIDADAILAVAVRRLSELLQVDRCVYCELEGDGTYRVRGEHRRGVPSLQGRRRPLSEFGVGLAAAMASDEPVVVEDSEADPRIAATPSAYREAEIRAAIWVPLHRWGRPVAALAIHQATPRRWTAAEVGLLRMAVDRCWETLARAEVTRALRASEARYRAIVETTPECVKLVDAEGRLLQMNPAGLTMIEAAEPSEVLGESIYPIIAAEHRDAYVAFNERICRGERGSIEYDLIGLRGGRRHMESAAVPLQTPDGRFLQLGVSRVPDR